MSYYLQRDIFGKDAMWQFTNKIDINRLRHAEPSPTGRICNANISRTHTSPESPKGTIRAGMAIRSNNDSSRQNKTFFGHDLMTDTFLQDGNTLLTCEPTYIALQCGRCNR